MRSPNTALQAEQDALLVAIDAVLAPLAQLCVARGLPIQAVESQLRRSFVLAAWQAHEAAGTRIVLGGERVGPISSISASSFVVLGQTVNVTTSTFYGPSISGGLSGLAVGQVVEVHGIADTTPDKQTATFVALKPSPSEYRLQGRVTAHNVPDKTFSLGGLSMSYASTDADDVRIVPDAGTLVRVRLQPTSPAPAVWTVTRIRKPEDSFSGFSGEVEFKGTITAFTNSRAFSVNDLPVDARSATLPADESGIEAGAFVEVKGTLTSGNRITATRISFER